MNLARRERVRFTFPLNLCLIGLIALSVYRQDFALFLLLPISLLIFLELFILYFFRDPDRALPDDPDLIVSAADGLVVGLEQVTDSIFHLGPCHRVAVFLSVFDVHVNRAPCDGTLLELKHQPGSFLDVRHPEASQRNEYLAWKIATPHGSIQVRQIAGLVARRIVAWKAPEDKLTRGERIGMIRFGSRTEVYLPLTCKILVQVGDRVQGAHTPIARW